ncbi:MAG: polysaccharide biosynthesis/export protein [Pseudomonadota bacterium]|nr:polysaccharide biosynthesis/export protein [Pseudomonadota bacterium]
MHKINKFLYTFALLVIASVSSVQAAESAAPRSSYAPYLISPGDVLEVSVWKEDGLQKEVLVRPDGSMSYPLLGELQAGGKTVTQLQQQIASQIKRFIPDPVVTVSVLRINSKIFVVGKVKRPGEFIITQYADVMQALAMAGGLDPYAKPGDIKILRRVAGDKPAQSADSGKEIAIDFEYDDVSKGKSLEQNIILQNGDVVVVP